jgi:hypothetical protein
MYYYKKVSLNFSNSLSSILRDSQNSKYRRRKGGNPPVNPACYIDGNETKQDLDNFLNNSEKNTFIKGTTNDLLQNSKTKETEKDFVKKFHKAREKDKLIKNLILIKQKDQISFLKEEIDRLDQEIEHLNKKKHEKGLTTSDRMSIEGVIEVKKTKRWEYDKELNIFLEKSLKVSEFDSLKLANKIAASQLEELKKKTKN